MGNCFGKDDRYEKIMHFEISGDPIMENCAFCLKGGLSNDVPENF